MRIIGLDIGSKRIGIAISDALGLTAQGRPTLERQKDEDVIAHLRNMIRNDGAEEIVVGLPLNMNGSHGEKAREAASFADTLKKSLGIPVKLWDERMSTMEAERLMIEGNASRGKRKKKIDKLAAQIILQSYLDSKR